MGLSDEKKKAFDFAADVVKQLISLSTALVGLTVTFAKDIFPSGKAHSRILMAGWLVEIVSILFGLLGYMAITGSLAKDESPNVYAGNVKTFVVLQMFMFLAGVVILAIFGLKIVSVPGRPPSE